MQISPYNLLQEQQVGKQYQVWRIMVVCKLLNRTNGSQVRPIIERIFELAPDPIAMQTADLLEVLTPLGLQNQRQQQLRDMSADYVAGKPIAQCRGCGQYALDSVQIFVHGSTDVVTTDTWLNLYLDWKRKQP